MKKPNKLKNSTMAYAFLLATSPAWAQTKTGGAPPKDSGEDSSPPSSPPVSTEKRIGGGKTSPPPKPPAATEQDEVSITKVRVKRAKAKKVEECEVPKVRLRRPRPQHVTSFAFEPNKKRVVKLQFVMSKVPVADEKRVLVLLQSRCLSRKPQIETKQSENDLALDFRDVKQLGTFDIPAQKSSASSARAMIFDVPLDTGILAEQLKAGNETFYFQVGLLKKSDFDNQHYDEVILSPLEAVHFTPKACPNQKQFSRKIRVGNASCKQLPGKSK